ncbi:MAG TPA: VOC family protein [Acidimicrobiia bacterium]|jgi:PhnB protein|nr:VOC family protein [Acidimicrobiia bacterium]
MAVKPIPDGSPRVVPYLTIEGADKAIEFYKNVLGATETVRMPGPDGNIGHAEMTIGDSLIMLADAAPAMNILGPNQVGGTPVTIMVYVEDVDATFARALSEGATETRPVENQFYGDRAGQFIDPFGHRWHIATHVEDVTPEQMQERMAQMFGTP